MKTVEEVLGPEGLLSQTLDRYEHREQQIEMAKAVLNTIKSRKPLIVEAATGTGKTLAYLVPALLSGKRVLVSTGTKALQEQLFQKDIPFLQKIWPTDFTAVLLKGRTNYLCKLRFDEMKSQPSFRSPTDARHWPKILSWGRKTSTGDRADIPGLPDEFPTWADLSVGAEACLGTKCDHYEDCFITKARREAQTAQIVVVNHHLFFADLAVKKSGFGEILPQTDAVVFDEAHHVEQTATSYFGRQVSNYRVRDLVGDIERHLEKEGLESDLIDDAANELTKASKAFFSALNFGLYSGRYTMAEALANDKDELVKPELRRFLEAYESLAAAILRETKIGEAGERFRGRCMEQRFDLRQIMDANDPKFVYFVEMRNNGTFIQAAPIDLAEMLRADLLDKNDRIVFTSATLSTGGTFEFFEKRLGISGLKKEQGDKEIEIPDISIERMILPAVFDYQKQALVYIPRRLPAPNKPGYVEGVCTIVEYLLGITEGRAFVLFTSYSNMNKVHEELEDKLPYKVFKQGDAPKAELLKSFRKNTHSVLFATASFWEGVDVEGESLSLVIIDKLPFANPSDPLTAARLRLLDERGGDSFREFSMPLAALTLKQGFGRLIRSKTDVGAVAILDSRIATRSYGQYFLQSLPPAPVVYNASQFKAWWQNLD